MLTRKQSHKQTHTYIYIYIFIYIYIIYRYCAFPTAEGHTYPDLSSPADGRCGCRLNSDQGVRAGPKEFPRGRGMAV